MEGTVTNYTRSVGRWTEFARVNSFNVFPESVIDVSLFISHLSATYKSSAVIQSSYCALKRVHEIAGVHNPMESKFLQNLVEGAKREHAKPVSKKTPVTNKALEACSIKCQGCNTLTVRRDISMSLQLFAGFLRYNELAHLRVNDVVICDTHLQLTLGRAKQTNIGKATSWSFTGQTKSLAQYLILKSTCERLPSV